MRRRSHGWTFVPRHILQLCNQPPQGPCIPQKLPLTEAPREPPMPSPFHRRLFEPIWVWHLNDVVITKDYARKRRLDPAIRSHALSAILLISKVWTVRVNKGPQSSRSI